MLPAPHRRRRILPLPNCCARRASCRRPWPGPSGDVCRFRKQDTTLSDDVAINDGRQDITLTGGAHAYVLVVGDVAYISGNQTALIEYFGLPAALARQVGNRWISVRSSSNGYSTIAAGATLPSVLSEITPVGALAETAPTELDGETLVGIRGRASLAFGQPGSETTS